MAKKRKPGKSSSSSADNLSRAKQKAPKSVEEQLRASEARFRAIFEASGTGMSRADAATSKMIDVNETLAQMLGYRREELQQKSLLDVIHPDDRPFHQDQIAKLRAGKISTYSVDNRYLRRDGTPLWVHATMNLVHEGEGHAEHMVTVAINIEEFRRVQEELRELNESLEQQVADRVELMSILQDVAIISNESHRIDAAVLAVLERICEYDHWVLGHAYRVTKDPSHRMIPTNIWYIHDNLRSDPEKMSLLEEFQRSTAETQFQSGECLIGHVLEAGEIVCIDDVDQYDQWQRSTPSKFGLYGAVAFPVSIDSQVVAVVECFASHTINKEQRFKEILTNVGIQLGHVFERKRLERAIALSVAEQQRTIGQELHDSVAQELTGSGMLAESLRLKLAEENSPHAEEVGILVKYLRGCVARVRQLSHGLIPVDVDSEGLHHALSKLAEQSRELYRVPVELVGQKAVTVEDNDTAVHLYRIAKEAIQNAVKHGAPQRVEIELKEQGNSLILTIRDDGTGIQEGYGSEGGMGQRIMQYRADLIGGKLEVASRANQGVTVTCRLPSPKRREMSL